MILKKDNFWFGSFIGLLAPVLGIFLFKTVKFSGYPMSEMLQYMYHEPGYRTLSAGLSLSLLLNALFFTIYINAHKDKTAKGIFAFTVIYGLFVLILKTFG